MSMRIGRPFSRLPDETIAEIIRSLVSCRTFSIPFNEHILQVSLCSKRLRRIALPSLYHWMRVTSNGLILAFIYHLVERPHYAPLVRELELTWEDPDSLEEVQKSARDVEYQLYLQDLRSHAIPENLIYGIKWQIAWANALSLLHQLTRLEKLLLQPAYDVYSIIGAGMPHLFQFQRAAPCIRYFALESDMVSSIDFDAELLIPAFLCSSMMEIQGHSMLSSEEKLEDKRLLPLGTTREDWFGKSSVQILRLLFAKVYGDDLDQLLRLPFSLKTFIYEDRDDYTYPYPTPDEVFRRNLDHVSSSLEYLSVHWNENETGYRPQKPWNLQDFTLLLKLNINYTLLIGSDPDIIVDHLPSCLEILILFSRFGGYFRQADSEVLRCFKVVLTKKSTACLARLRIVSHQCWWKLNWGTLSQLASEKGVGILPASIAVHS
jgi:hypothetical protein